MPLLLSANRDEELLKLTEHRVATFIQDLIPDYMRTRPNPEVEGRHMSLESKVVQAEDKGSQVSPAKNAKNKTKPILSSNRVYYSLSFHH